MIQYMGDGVYQIQSILTSIIFTKYLGAIGGYIVNTSILFFAMATIVGWFHYGDRALLYLFKNKYNKVSLLYKLLWILVTFVGGIMNQSDVIWKFSNIANALMAFPNLLALVILTPIVVKITKDFFSSKSPSI